MRIQRGDRIGRFLILELIGEGGMGRVLAAYDDRLERKVAVKILHPHVAEKKEAKARFLREARALARLNHPNVVTVLDADYVDDQIYIAMEFVDGQNVREWARVPARAPSRPGGRTTATMPPEESLSEPVDGQATVTLGPDESTPASTSLGPSGPACSWREVLDVMLQAGEGLAAAHRAKLVHRDFKPEHVSISKSGQVRVLDFGLVSQLSEPGITAPPDSLLNTFEVDVKTRAGSVMGTPAYMAPEQFDGKPPDPRVDQFAFCATLYEVLYGQLAFGGTSVPELRDQVQRGRVNDPPPKTDVPAWVHRIIVKGLSANPQDRYDSMDALLAALRRDPLALPRRVAWGAAGVLVVGVLTLATSQLVGTGKRLCRHAGDRASTVWDASRAHTLEQAFAATGHPIAADTFAKVDASIGGYLRRWREARVDTCEATHVRGEQSAELLDLRMACLDRRLDELDALAGVLSAVDGESLPVALQAVYALPPVDVCARTDTLRARTPRPTNPEDAAKLSALEQDLDRLTASYETGGYQQGLEPAKRAYQRAVELDYAPALAEAAYLLGRYQHRSGHPQEARETYDVALLAADRAGDDYLRFSVLLAAQDVAHTLDAREDMRELHAAAGSLVDRLGRPPLLHARYVKQSAGINEEFGELEQARADAEEAIRILQSIPDVSPFDLISAYNQYGLILKSMSDYEKAREPFRMARELARESIGSDNQKSFAITYNSGMIESNLGAYDEAIGYYKEAIDIAERVYGKDHYYFALANGGLADVYFDTGRYADALPIYLEELRKNTEAFGPDHKKVAFACANLGITYQSLHDEENAVRYGRRAVELARKNFGDVHPDTAQHLNMLGGTYETFGRYDEAKDCFAESLAISRKTQGKQMMDALKGMGSVLLAQGRPRDALRYLEEGLQFLEEHPDQPRHHAKMELMAGKALAASGGDKIRATTLIRSAHDRLVKLAPAHADMREEAAAWLEKNDATVAVGN